MFTAIARQAERFGEHILADAKAEERLTEDEKASLRWLLNNLWLTPHYRAYVESQIVELRFFTRVATGWLPSIDATTGVELRAGEITHYEGHAYYIVVRQLKSGPRTDSHVGRLVITDSRLIFVSDTKPVAVN